MTTLSAMAVIGTTATVAVAKTKIVAHRFVRFCIGFCLIVNFYSGVCSKDIRRLNFEVICNQPR